MVATEKPYIGDQIFGGLQMLLAAMGIIYLVNYAASDHRPNAPMSPAYADALQTMIFICILILIGGLYVGYALVQSRKWAMIVLLVCSSITCTAAFSKDGGLNVVIQLVSFLYSLIRVAGLGPPLR